MKRCPLYSPCKKLHVFCCLLLSGSVISDCLQPHGLRHARLPCPSLSPWVCSNFCPLCQWYHQSSHPALDFLGKCLRSQSFSWVKVMYHIRRGLSPSQNYNMKVSQSPFVHQKVLRNLVVWTPLSWFGKSRLLVDHILLVMEILSFVGSAAWEVTSRWKWPSPNWWELSMFYLKNCSVVRDGNPEEKFLELNFLKNCWDSSE